MRKKKKKKRERKIRYFANGFLNEIKQHLFFFLSSL